MGAEIMGGIFNRKSKQLTVGELKCREARARRVAIGCGLRVEKSRIRDPNSPGLGEFTLIDRQTNRVVAGGNVEAESMTLDAVEDVLAAVQTAQVTEARRG